MQKVLTQGFSTFLRRRRVKRHFERRPLLDALVAAPVPAPAAGGERRRRCPARRLAIAGAPARRRVRPVPP